MRTVDDYKSNVILKAASRALERITRHYLFFMTGTLSRHTLFDSVGKQVEGRLKYTSTCTLALLLIKLREKLINYGMHGAIFM